jgi:hypothetical protein
LTEIYAKCENYKNHDLTTKTLVGKLFDHLCPDVYPPYISINLLDTYLEGIKEFDTFWYQELFGYYCDGVLGYNDNDRSFDFKVKGKFFEYLLYIYKL